MLLAIDTATRSASVALYTAAGVQSEITWRSRENHTVELMAQIVHAMRLAQVEKKDLLAIGVASGPGSFTGLRVGMSVAKGLAFALKIPILGVPTLDAIAHGHSLQNSQIFAILAAGRERYSIAAYRATDGAAQRVGAYALVNADGLVELAARETKSSGALFCGELDTVLVKKIRDCLGARAVIASPAMNARRAAFLAELAWARLRHGESDDTASLAPIYAPHESVLG